MNDDKRRALDLAARYVCPDRVRTFGAIGVDLVIGRREGYRIWDLDGRELLDLHLNGGVFNLGHRHPELVAALREALDTLDIGNHHFPSVARAELAETLARTTPGDLQYVVFASERRRGDRPRHQDGAPRDEAAQDRVDPQGLPRPHGPRARGRRRALLAHVPLRRPAGRVRAGAVQRSRCDGGGAARHDVAAVVLETIPATFGFPLPAPGYLPGVKALCERYGALYVADEVQTGLGRTGPLWGVECFDVEPDILVTGKGLSGGLYPIAATVLTPRAGRWLEEDGWGHVSTFGGAELGCRVAQKVLEITTRPAVLANVAVVSDRLADGLETLRARHPDGSWRSAGRA